MKNVFRYLTLAVTVGAIVGCPGEDQIIGPPPPPPPPPPQAPAAPLALAAVASSETQINLSWTDNSSNEDGFHIERCSGSGCGGFVEIASVGANITTYQNTGLTASTNYSYRVRAYNGVGSSAYSTANSTTTLAPAISIPLTVGKRWRFEQHDTTTGCALSTGCSTTRFDGDHFVTVLGQVPWQGRTAAQVAIYTFQTNATSGSGFTTQTVYLSQDASGVDQWESSSWRRLLSTQQTAYSNGAFFLTQGPSYNQSMTQAASSITVPAGSYSTVRVNHSYTQTGQYAPEDIFVTEYEHWAPGIGPVFGRWDFSLDDNDPAGFDVTRRGSYRLVAVDPTLFPTIVAEAEPNDSTSQATVGTSFMVGTGNTALGDAGALMSDVALSCPLTECVLGNKNNVKRLEDWFRVPVTSSFSGRVALTLTGSTTDFDLYVFKAGATGLTYVGRSTNAQGQGESLTVSFTSGTYYVAVQAWDTPAGRANYTIMVR